jgi:hypothetical protein
MIGNVDMPPTLMACEKQLSLCHFMLCEKSFDCVGMSQDSSQGKEWHWDETLGKLFCDNP